MDFYCFHLAFYFMIQHFPLLMRFWGKLSGQATKLARLVKKQCRVISRRSFLPNNFTLIISTSLLLSEASLAKLVSDRPIRVQEVSV
jgi:hypothetical protein